MEGLDEERKEEENVVGESSSAEKESVMRFRMEKFLWLLLLLVVVWMAVLKLSESA